MRNFILSIAILMCGLTSAQQFIFSCAWDSGYNYDNTVWVAYDSDYPYWADIEGYNEDGTGVITAYVGGKETGSSPQGYVNFPTGVKYISATPQHMDWVLQAHSEFLHDGFDAAVTAGHEDVDPWGGVGTRGIAGTAFGYISYILEDGTDYKIAFKVTKYTIEFEPTPMVIPTEIEWRAWKGDNVDGYDDDTHIITSTVSIADLVSKIDEFLDQE